MAEFLTPQRRAVYLALWEGVVQQQPLVAGLAGPPSWLVLEEWNGKEPFAEANLRVRGRYGLGVPGDVPSVTEKPIAEPVTLAQVTEKPVTGCSSCGKPVTGYGKVCHACRQAAYRERRHGD